MTIESMIELIMSDVEAKSELIAMYSCARKAVPEIALETVQAQIEACNILREVQKIYEEIQKKDFGKD